jgi:hypothetical protein
MQILAYLQAFVAPVAFEHVEGHQDTKYPDEPLSWAAQLNQRCDEIATAHLDRATDPMPTVPFLPASTVSVSVGAHTITHHLPTQFRTFAGLAGIRQHLCDRHEWEEPTIFDLVDWPVFHSASLATTFLKRLFGIKMIHFLLPLQKQQYQFRQSPSASCPSACGCPEEDWVHFLRCPHLQRKQAWTALLVPTLSSTMERWQLDPSLRRLMLHTIVPLNTLTPIPLNDLADEYRMLLTTQRSIGEDSLVIWILFYRVGTAARPLPENPRSTQLPPRGNTGHPIDDTALSCAMPFDLALTQQPSPWNRPKQSYLLQTPTPIDTNPRAL